MGKKGTLKASSSKVKSISNEIDTKCNEIEKYLQQIETDNIAKLKTVWKGGTRSVKQFKNLEDTVAHSRNVLSKIRNVSAQCVGAATGINKSS